MIDDDQTKTHLNGVHLFGSPIYSQRTFRPSFHVRVFAIQVFAHSIYDYTMSRKH